MTRRRRAFATFIVLWVVVIGSVIIVTMQTGALSRAAGGRDALALVRAKWAARAGVEATIARLARDVINPHPSDAFAVFDDCEEVAEGSLADATWVIENWVEGQRYLGPADAHAKVNMARMTSADLASLDFMTTDLAERILDWADEDDDTRPAGAEIGVYQSKAYAYEPRNGPFLSIDELELVDGVDPYYVRGEDWNLNGVLDPEEDDGLSAGLRRDNGDGELDAGWSAHITPLSFDDVLAASGEERIELGVGADAGEIAQRTGMSAEQAQVIVEYGVNPGASLAQIITTPLNRLPSVSGQPINPQAQALSNEQLGALLDEATMQLAAGPVPGRVNINTVSDDTLTWHMPGVNSFVADALLAERRARQQGFVSWGDLLDVPGISRERLAELYGIFTVRSNTFIITSRGRDARTGVDVEIIATVDRSTLPITVLDLIIR
ncbi:MAG: helix-hairpin-helix domain-containing protein [Phycisphaerales bacterium JB039]